ncbi:MAG: DUF6159 family protein [Acidimicrobiia bacterium]
MGRIRTSWEIAKRSWSVLRSDKSLAWFPVFSFLGSVGVVAAVGGLIWAAGIDDSANGDALQPLGYVFIVFGYLGLALVQTYFLAALVAGADERLRGGNSTVRGALDVANARLHRLMPWAIVSATVSIALSMLERYGVVGRIIASLVGLAWNLVTFLTVPILVIEDIGIGHAFTRSKDLFKQTWGENVVGQAGLGVLGIFVMFPAVVLIVTGAALGTVGVIVFGAVGVAWLVVAATVMAALNGIYRTALYRFATTGQVPPDFHGTDFQGAFRPRRGPQFGSSSSS